MLRPTADIARPDSLRPIMKIAHILLALAVSATLTGCATQTVEPDAPKSTVLEDALDSCEMSNYTPGVRLGDDGYSLILDMKGTDDIEGLDFTDLSCVLAEVEIPDSTLAIMESTRALDGRQTGDWDDITATWSYHPDAGLDIVLELAEPKESETP